MPFAASIAFIIMPIPRRWFFVACCIMLAMVSPAEGFGLFDQGLGRWQHESEERQRRARLREEQQRELIRQRKLQEDRNLYMQRRQAQARARRPQASYHRQAEPKPTRQQQEDVKSWPQRPQQRPAPVGTRSRELAGANPTKVHPLERKEQPYVPKRPKIPAEAATDNADEGLHIHEEDIISSAPHPRASSGYEDWRGEWREY